MSKVVIHWRISRDLILLTLDILVSIIPSIFREQEMHLLVHSVPSEIVHQCGGLASMFL